ncbi:hypothetical protein NKR23_g4569 [Pleurostoma richardsiae]|uniref:Uncharacterized protein n=1 Tax=Pleurostoma richardsiae TaxID=41990 RepID=A0AA38VFK8_9PEZI|nr:hypothetical protein NKR23_g4569 [Pleurostoma richardsiae]
MDLHHILCEDDDGSSSQVFSKAIQTPSSATSVDTDQANSPGGPCGTSGLPRQPRPGKAKQFGPLRREPETCAPLNKRPLYRGTNDDEMSRLQAIALEPRPFESLHTERSYMLYTLQGQDERARRLLFNLSTAEDRLAAAQGGAQAKKLQKHIAALKTKVAKTAAQEKHMLLRLGELYIEIQSRERQNAVQQLKLMVPREGAAWPPVTQHAFMLATTPVTPICTCVPAPPPYHLASPASASPLSPISPCFVPSGPSFFGNPPQHHLGVRSAKRNALKQDQCTKTQAEAQNCQPQPANHYVSNKVLREQFGARSSSVPDIGPVDLGTKRRMSVPAQMDGLND